MRSDVFLQKDKMADQASQLKTTTATPITGASPASTPNPVIPTPATQQTTAAANAQASIQQDTKVRTAGTSLAEFFSQLDDYTPTVSITFTLKNNYLNTTTKRL